MARESRLFEGEENGFESFQRGFVLFSLHLEIRHPVLSREGPGILNLGIRIHFGPAEAHILADGIREIVVHDRVIEISIGAEIRQRVVSDKLIGRDIDQRIGGRVGGQAEEIPFVTRPVNRQHQKAAGRPAPLAEGLTKIRVRFWNLPFGPHVENPRHADRGVASEPVGFIAGAAPFSLEQIVDQPSWVREVLAKISDSSSNRLHDDESIDPAGRLDDAGHKPLVEGPHHPIQWFDGVGDGFWERNGFRGRRWREANGGSLPVGD